MYDAFLLFCNYWSVFVYTIVFHSHHIFRAYDFGLLLSIMHPLKNQTHFHQKYLIFGRLSFQHLNL